MNRKAQISMYLIAGMVILIGVLFYIYFNNQIDASKPNTEPIVDEIPGDYKKFQRYILDCVEITAMRGIKKLGEHGGYIDMRNYNYAGRTFNFVKNPTDSDVLFLGENPIPYYWYMETPFDCKECYLSYDNIPAKRQLVEQLELYIDSHLDACFNFNSFENEGFEVVVKDKHSTSVVLTDNRVLAQTTFPIDIVKGNTVTQMENFGVDIVAPVSASYDLAKHIAKEAEETQYLEKFMMTLISYYSGIDSSKLPPISHLDMKGSLVKWSKDSTKSRIVSLLNSHSGIFRVQGTQNYEQIDAENIYESALFKITQINNSKEYENISVHFYFLDWPIHFDITPSSKEGGLTGSSYKTEFPLGMVPSIRSNHYEFFYDIAFPVMVELRDDSALQGHGFSYFFALEANIRDNKNLVQWLSGDGVMEEWDSNSIEYRFNYDDYPEVNRTEVEQLMNKKTLVCNENQMLGGPIQIQAFDSRSLQPIKDATVTFKCGTYQDCLMDSVNSRGYFNSKVPICVGGALVVEHEDYVPYLLGNFSVFPDRPEEYEIYMKKKKKMFVSAKTLLVKQLNKTKKKDMFSRAQLRQFALPLDENETVIISMNRVQNNIYEIPYAQSVMIKGETYGSVYMIPGKYHVTATLMDEKGIITRKYQEINEDGSITKYPSVNLTPVNIGGVYFNENTGPWFVSDEDMENNSIVFYIPELKKPKTVKDVGQIGELEKYSKANRLLLQPEFK